MKKLRKFAAVSAGTMLALSAFSAPQIANAEPTDPGATQEDPTAGGAEGESDALEGGIDDDAENDGSEADDGTGAGNEDDGEAGEDGAGDGADDGADAGDETGDISFESSQGKEITPGETLTLTPDDREVNVFIEKFKADPGTAAAWTAEADEETGEVKITAPAAPEDQEEGVDVEYGEHTFTLVTNTGFEYELTLNFVAGEEDDAPEDPEEPSSISDVREQLRNLSSDLSSGELSSNLSSN